MGMIIGCHPSRSTVLLDFPGVIGICPAENKPAHRYGDCIPDVGQAHPTGLRSTWFLTTETPHKLLPAQSAGSLFFLLEKNGHSARQEWTASPAWREYLTRDPCRTGCPEWVADSKDGYTREF